MKILADHDVWAVTLNVLADAGHDVVTASDLGLAQATDTKVLAQAVEDRRILITRDRDFGRLVFADERSGGIVYLRIQPSTENAVHRELLNVLAKHSTTEILQSFIVIEPGQYRIRDLG
jgi:predicted nuclease of predicted toxin-antitoxin system